ncbi:VWA domain-containing protein [Gulosibacter molinativorax]|uniref:VWA domain-containing protein n=1 Tax=Gulosibacter molinativorax TaxID=256821 RepID=A0ABT7C3M3_9MICO|nr:VWA domain-containing protein [Gulosibacter molinativorax]MDJ1369857.1 VWA domain-containing protein [Gulosibacter molinativorax]QUY61822.1 von Willebrand factor A [Gulosibacter molinativorax]
MALAYWWLPFLVAAIVVVLAVVVFVWEPKRKRGGVPIANSERLTKLPGYLKAIDRANAAAIVAAVVVIALIGVTTMASARWVYTKVETPEKYNRDIVLCLDVSGSMVDFDARVIDRYLEMLPGFEGERMSLVLWNSSAVPVFPLTDDYRFIEEQLTQVRDSMLTGVNSSYFNSGTLNNAGASLVGDGLASCVMQFEGASPSEGGQPVDDDRSRSVILATDNVVNGSQTVSLPQAAEFARQHFVNVYALDANDMGDAYAAEYRNVIESHDGQYFSLEDDGAIDTIVDDITSDQTNKIEGAPQLLVIDRPETWLWWMLILVPVYLVFARRLRI